MRTHRLLTRRVMSKCLRRRYRSVFISGSTALSRLTAARIDWRRQPVALVKARMSDSNCMRTSNLQHARVETGLGHGPARITESSDQECAGLMRLNDGINPA